jgi:sec-independent protein translocase protein TatA
MFGRLGPLEIGLIVLIVLIIFGAGKLPQVFRSAGRGIRDFRRAQAGEFDEEEKPKDSIKETEKK